MFVASVVITLAGCHLLRTASSVGKRLEYFRRRGRECVAAVGTTLPGNIDSNHCHFFGAGREQMEVGLGAILGAPFMLQHIGAADSGAPAGALMPSWEANSDLQAELWRGAGRYQLLSHQLCAGAHLRDDPFLVLHVAVAAVPPLAMYVYYMKLKFSAEDEESEGRRRTRATALRAALR